MVAGAKYGSRVGTRSAAASAGAVKGPGPLPLGFQQFVFPQAPPMSSSIVRTVTSAPMNRTSVSTVVRTPAVLVEGPTKVSDLSQDDLNFWVTKVLGRCLAWNAMTLEQKRQYLRSWISSGRPVPQGYFTADDKGRFDLVHHIVIGYITTAVYGPTEVLDRLIRRLDGACSIFTTLGDTRLAYPAGEVAAPAPSWESAVEGSATFYRNIPSGRQLCSTTGWDALADIQGALRDRLQTTGPLPAWDGTPVTADMVSVTSPDLVAGWSAPMLRALYAVAAHDAPRNSIPQFLAATQADAGTGQVSKLTLALALWVTYLSHSYTASGVDAYGSYSPLQIIIPSDTILPSFAVAPQIPVGRAASGVSGVRCTRVAIPSTGPSGLMVGAAALGVAALIAVLAGKSARKP